ncbi:MAG: type 1 glutamine amidotransferase [Bacteriovoracia bacterium]
MKVLIIDNNIDLDCWGAHDLSHYSRFAPHATFYVRRGPHADLPTDPTEFSRIIVSGSRTSALSQDAWVSKLEDFLRRTIDAQVPVLGVCYGHQLLARVLGGVTAVRRASVSEFGWIEIEVLKDSPLFRGLPKKFYTFAAHYDEVPQPPAGFLHTARSRDCVVQAYHHPERPIYGIQFHPERTLAGSERTIREQIKKGEGAQVFNPKLGAKLYDPEVGNAIFRNFLGDGPEGRAG